MYFLFLFFFILLGEENPEQIASRAKRLQLDSKGTFLICDINVDNAGKYFVCNNAVRGFIYVIVYL